MPADARIVFLPSGRRGLFPHGTTLLDAARSLGVDLDSVCGGRGLCGRCRVVLAEGDFAKHQIHSSAEHLSPSGEVEARYSARRGPLEHNHRLGCQARIQGNLVIDVPPESQVHRQIVRKSAEFRDFTLRSAVHLYCVEVAESRLSGPAGDLQRLYTALADEWQLSGLGCDPVILPTLQKTLREGGWMVTAAVHDQTRVSALWPGFKRYAYGLAIDIGSTTIATHLCNLATGEVVATSGAMNPQIRYGEDLMSRVSYVQMHPEGADELTRIVRGGINELIARIASEAGIDAADILELSVVGNPIMHHLFLGLDPSELGGAPFALVTDAAMNLRARDLDLRVNPGANVFVLPCVAGHVGADAAGAILAERPDRSDEITLLVDVGTNAEIVLGNRDRLLACSSPTGPAFEGAQISCGQRAAAGAIERVRIDPDTLESRFRVIGSDLWSDDPDFAESTRAFGITGICGSGIIEAVAEMYLCGIVTPDGVIDGALAARSPRLVRAGRTWSFVLHDGNPAVTITQNDVRQIQLAKAALYAGVKLLMEHASVTRLDNIRLAGAFGSHIDPRYAMVLGMIPDCDLDRVRSAGNAAGTGAVIALLNIEARAEIQAVVHRIEKIETAVEPRFQEYFVDAMAIPNKEDRFPRLFSVVRAPVAAAAANEDRYRRRHRKRAD